MPYKDQEQRRRYHREYNKRWHREHPEMAAIYSRRYDAKGKRKPGRSVVQNRKRYHRYKYLALVKYSQDPPSCSCCAEDIYEFLTIDHIKGGGSKHRKSLNSYNGGMYRWLVDTRKKPKKFRVLCMNCNIAVFHHGVCPHKLNTGEMDD